MAYIETCSDFTEGSTSTNENQEIIVINSVEQLKNELKLNNLDTSSDKEFEKTLNIKITRKELDSLQAEMFGILGDTEKIERLKQIIKEKEIVKNDTQEKTENLKQDILEPQKEKKGNLIKYGVEGMVKIIKTPIEILDAIRKGIINEINEEEFKELCKKRDEVVVNAIKTADKLPIRICYTDVENNINICYPEEINFDSETQTIIIGNDRFNVNIPDNPDPNGVKNCKLKNVTIDGSDIIFNFSFIKSGVEYPDFKSTKSKKELIEIVSSLLNTGKYEKKGNYIIINITKEQ